MANVTVEIRETDAVVEVGTSGPQGATGAQGPAGGGATDLTSLSDVAITSAAANHYLTRGTTEWVNRTGLIHDARNYASIQAALDAARDAGGGEVYLTPGTTHDISSVLTLRNYVLLNGNGATLRWTGADGGTMVTTGGTDPTIKAGVHNIRIDTGGEAGADWAFHLRSPEHCTFRDIQMVNGATTLTNFLLVADVTNLSGLDGTRNAIFNIFENIEMATNGSGFVLDGNTTGIITLNTFIQIQMRDVRSKAIRFVDWCDNNWFHDVRIALSANNSIAVIYNDSATPAANVGVYTNNFNNLAIDVFGAHTGRQLVVFNWTKENSILGGYFGDATHPPIVDNNSQSHFVMTMTGIDDLTPRIYAKRLTFVGEIFFGDGGRITITNPTPYAATHLNYNNTGQNYFRGASHQFDANPHGFFGATPIAKPAVTGSRGANAALASLLTALANLGLVTDSSTA